MYVCLSVTLFFWKPYILQHVHFLDILFKYKIFKKKSKIGVFKKKFFQKSSLLLYKSWFSTVSFYICHNIYFIGSLIDLLNMKSLTLRNKNFSSNIFFKSRLCFYINLDFYYFILKLPKYTFHFTDYNYKIKNLLQYFFCNILFYMSFLFRSYGWFIFVFI